MARMAPDRRLATLLALTHAFEGMAMDDALDLLDLVITEIINAAQSEGEKERLRTLRNLDTAALQLWEAIQRLLDAQIADAVVRRRTFAQIPRQQLVDAGTQVETRTRPPDDRYDPALVERYQRVRRFLPTVFATVAFEGTQAGQPLLAAWRFLADLAQ